MVIELPETLPIFPLSGVLLLPGGRLPLHVFELRYRNMVEDALQGEHYLGVIQPCESVDVLQDELPEPTAAPPSLYRVGCAGMIERSESLADGRYVILLRGACRFRWRRELPLRRGYRRVEADYSEFAFDESVDEAAITSERLMRALRTFGEVNHIAFELDKLRELPGLALLNSVAMALPFPPAEKQAILEAPDVEQRCETLITLMNMGIEMQGDATPAPLN